MNTLKTSGTSCFPQCGGCSSLVVLKSIWKCSECPVSKLLPSPLTVFHFLWTQPALVLSVSLWSFFGNISQHFIYNLRDMPVPYSGRLVHSEYVTIQAYQLTDFKERRNACVVSVSMDLCAQLTCVRGPTVATV